MKKMLPFVLCVLAASSAAAQSDRSRLLGTIYDSSGAVLPNAQVSVTNQLTRASREVSSDASGNYRIENLLPAPYQVSATAAGFSRSTAPDVIIAAGQERTVHLHLQPEGVTESVAVTADAPLVDTGSARIGASVSNREVDNLPLNGRQVAQLYLLVPGATSTGSGTFNDLRFAGRANEQNVIRYDGIEAGTIIDSNPGDINGSGGGATAFRLSQSLENIQEFRVESSNYNAEHGRGTGGQITVITKSGSNAFHGGLFENVRHDKFDSRNYFDTGATPAPLSLNQFGGSLGGPIFKDRLFFFAANENLFQRVYVPFRSSTLSAFARAQAVPAIRPLLAAFPVGTEPTSSPFFDLVSQTLPSSVNEHFWNVRVDARIDRRSSLYIRYSDDRGDSTTPTDVSGSATVLETRPRNAIADLTTVLSPNMVNDFKVGYNALKSANIRQGVVLPGLDLSNVTLSIGGAAQSGSTGIVTPTGAGSTPLVQGMTYDNYEWEIINNLSWNRGAHSWKTGFEINPRVMYMDQLGGIVYTFATVQTFLNNQPSRVQLSSDLGASPSPFHSGSTGLRKGLQTFYGAFIQDEWRAKSNVTINLGLRYDYFTALREDQDRAVGVNTVTGALELNGQPFYAVSKTNFGPRAAVTWAPARMNGRTVVKAGGGLYYGPGQGEDQTQLILNDFVVTTPTGVLPYPVNRPQLLATWDPYSPTAAYQPRIYGADYKLPETVASYTFSVQQALPGQSTLTVAYVGSRGWNLFQRTISNMITGVTMNPTSGAAIIQRQFGDRYSEMDVKTSGGTNRYDGLLTSWNRRLGKGVTAIFNYTLGRNFGTSGGSNEAITSENNFDFSQEYGSNSSDIRHSMNAAAVWDIPFGASHGNQNSVANAILGDWQVGGSLNARTGLPLNVTVSRPDVLYQDSRTGLYYTAPILVGGRPVTTPVINIVGGGSSRGTQRPDLVPGVDPYVSAGNGFHLNPAAFAVPLPGTYGNLQRNSLRGLAFAQFDLSLTKRVRLAAGHTLELRADVYNLFDRVNFANPTTVLSAATPSSPTAAGAFIQPGQAYSAATAGSSFGLLSSTVGRYVDMGTARQMQFSIRYRF